MPTLDYFTKPDDASDTVLIGAYVEPVSGQQARYIIMSSDAKLSSRAATEGKSAWDEDTICAEHGLTRKPKPTASAPTPTTAPATSAPSPKPAA